MRTPLTLSVKCDKFLKRFIGSIPDEKELHLLVDIFKMEEHPHTLFGKGRVIFDYFAIEDEAEREEFFSNYHKYKSVYSPMGRTNKLTPEQILSRIEQAGFNRITRKVIKRYYNPVKVRIRLDKYVNKQLRRYEL